MNDELRDRPTEVEPEIAKSWLPTFRRPSWRDIANAPKNILIWCLRKGVMKCVTCLAACCDDDDPYLNEYVALRIYGDFVVSARVISVRRVNGDSGELVYETELVSGQYKEPSFWDPYWEQLRESCMKLEKDNGDPEYIWWTNEPKWNYGQRKYYADESQIQGLQADWAAEQARASIESSWQKKVK